MDNQPTNRPTGRPTNNQPTNEPTNQPTNQQTANQPASKPTNRRTNQPTNQPTDQPTNQPANQPTNQPTDSMEQMPSWQANSSSACQEIPCILSNPKIHYRIHKNQPPIPIPSEINPVHAFHPTFLRSVLILSSQIRLGLPSGVFPPRLPNKTLHAPLLSLIHATSPALLSFLHLTTRIMFGEYYTA